MTVHVSVRLPWHDRGWDGHICDRPRENAYCAGNRSVNAERIRTNKDTAAEERCRGCHANQAGAYTPPCTETINVFGPDPVAHTYEPMEFMRGTRPQDHTFGPYSSGTWTFEEMWDEQRRARSAEVRREKAGEFFDALEPKSSLIFYYCNYDNPVTTDEAQYLLVGVARLKQVHDPLHWRVIPRSEADKYGGFIWSRVLENGFPAEGVRFPYQEYLNLGYDPAEVRERAVVVSADLARRFKYVARHVSDDDATMLLEQAIRAFKRFKAEGKVTGPGWDWDQQIAWLDAVLRECWQQRGPWPGLAPVLEFCQFPNPGSYLRELKERVPAHELRDYVMGRLDGRAKPFPAERSAYAAVRPRWDALDPAVQALCRETLPRFDLTEEQVQRILSAEREHWGITSSLRAIEENPYCLAEEYIGKEPDDRISFHRVDHGMAPDPAAGSPLPSIELDDPRRLRALMVSFLEVAAAQGHTFLDWADLSLQLREHHQASGRVGRFLVDDATWRQHQPFFTEKLHLDQVQGLQAVFLRRLFEAENLIRKRVTDLIKEGLRNPSGLKWPQILRSGRSGQGRSLPEADREQADALERLYRAYFAVLTGGAGTGKTTVLQTLLAGLRQAEPGHSFLLLAPTGKAATVMSRRTGEEASTVHSFLARQAWLNFDTGALLASGGKKAARQTIIIDEASMLPADLLATLFRALNWNEVERLILVGDPNQLPPIGPGKAFADIIYYLGADEQRAEAHLAKLQFNCRQAQGSLIIPLAAHFSRTEETPDEEILWQVIGGQSKEDLSVRFWQSDDELDALLTEVLTAATHQAASTAQRQGAESLAGLYDAIHGIRNLGEESRLEMIQVLAPYRHSRSGITYLNQQVQDLLRTADAVRRYGVKGFVRGDKVLQMVNVYHTAYDHQERKSTRGHYVPNGALGYLFDVDANKGQVQAKFPPDTSRLSFYLSGGAAEENLELGYAMTVHKAQGSQFQHTILILPKDGSAFISRELLYTALTRAEGHLWMLLEGDAGLLKERLWAGHAELLRRNSSLFRTAKGVRLDQLRTFHPEAQVEQALPDLLVRSRGEVEVARALSEAEIPFYYERPLLAADGQTFRIPDFTFKFRRKEYYWEHLGMLGNAQYEEAWKRKQRWYQANGFGDRLLVTPVEGMDLAQSIRYILHDRLGV